MLEEILKQIIAEKKQQGLSHAVIINFLREYIQYLTLNLIYNQKKYRSMIFKGGSCLRICFKMPRLSEDLDFDYDKKKLGGNLIGELKEYISKEIKTKYFLPLETTRQSNTRLYLKFPFLRALNLAKMGESAKLYVKVETSDQIEPYAGFEVTPISEYGFNFVVRHYDLPTLMAGKINAFLFRLWFKGEKQEIDIKGRDFYDLYWYFDKGVKPNWKTLKKMTGIANEKQLKSRLFSRIKKVVTPKKLSYDLKNFFPDQVFVSDFSRNYLEIIKKYLK